MVALTLVLFAVAGILLVANGVVSLLPKKGTVSVAFIPPTTGNGSTPPNNARLEAHIQATNHKINGLFSRVEALEKKVSALADPSPPIRDETWLETVPVRNRPGK